MWTEPSNPAVERTAGSHSLAAGAHRVLCANSEYCDEERRQHGCPVEVRAVGRCRIRLRYQDGSEGEVDLSHLAARGVSAAWDAEGCSRGWDWPA